MVVPERERDAHAGHPVGLGQRQIVLDEVLGAEGVDLGLEARLGGGDAFVRLSAQRIHLPDGG